jgi:hypothetical protein
MDGKYISLALRQYINTRCSIISKCDSGYAGHMCHRICDHCEQNYIHVYGK